MPPIPPPRASGLTTSTPVPLHWVRYGEAGAPPLLVLHGGPGADHRYLLPQMLELARGRELVLYDQRGGGASRTDDPTPVTWRTQVEDVARVADELLPEQPLTVVGYSWGALLAMLHAIETADGADRRPPRRLVLIDPAPVTRQYRSMFESEFARRQNGGAIQGMRTALAASGLRESDPDAYRQRGFELSVAGYFADPEKARDLTPFRVTGKVQASVWESLGDFDLLPALTTLRQRLRIPALVVHGRQDPIPLASATACADALDARLVVLEGCGHVPYVEQPVALFDAIGTFLRDTDAVSA